MRLVNPLQQFGTSLCSVQNPSTYIGGETGQSIKPHAVNDTLFNFAIAFPDLYGIAMSNQAIKIIYNGLNAIQSVRCERVFAVEADFENLLRKNKVPLYTLETGMALSDVDMIGFSIGYELGITGVLSILELGNVPLLKKNRTEKDPIVIAGGCGVTNPAVFSDFFDAVFIGEAEPELFNLVKRLSEMKKNGANRDELLHETVRCPFVWSEGMSDENCGHSIAQRAVQADFGIVPSIQAVYPLPNVKPVQDHGVIEIMRGCPNGCRFCHAGIYYRPQRIKTYEQIFAEADRLITVGGYRQISLTSLSSGDYPNIGDLLDRLNERYGKLNVSFQLPSLKVNSFTLPILEKISEVRKSGLTFAVETPDEAWQLRLNKEVYAQRLVDIILEAKKRGWNKAKFYFMVGLPFPETAEKTEEQVIVDFLLQLQQQTGIQCNVNVGTFIPKPHTPFQWVKQISPEESDKKLSYIRSHLPRGKFHVGTHDIFTSYLEGLVSRGDSRAGKVILDAYKKGCRLDAWEDHIRADQPLWEESFREAGYDVRKEILRERSKDEPLPWDTVSLGPSKYFYNKEWDNCCKEVLTPNCSSDCNHHCGVCKTGVSVRNQQDLLSKDVYKVIPIETKQRELVNIRIMHRAVFSFSKLNGGEFISHLAQVEIFSRAIISSGLPIIFSTGFNPLPRLEFATTLSLGISSLDEIASVVLYDPITENDFVDTLNKFLVPGLKINHCFIFPVTNQRKRESLSASLWGNDYRYQFLDSYDYDLFLKSPECIAFLSNNPLCSVKQESEKSAIVHLVFSADKLFRTCLSDFFGKKIYEIVKITKIATLAKPDIIGWTPEMNNEYRQNLLLIRDHELDESIQDVNKTFRQKVLHAEDITATETTVSYFELYKKIAVINKKLIDQRESVDAEKNN